MWDKNNMLAVLFLSIFGQECWFLTWHLCVLEIFNSLLLSLEIVENAIWIKHKQIKKIGFALIFRKFNKFS